MLLNVEMEKDHSDIVSEPIIAPTIQESSTSVGPSNSLLSMLASISIEDIPMAVKYLVDKLAKAQKQKTTSRSTHTWDNYQLSAKVISMAPSKRKEIYGNYDVDLTDILEEKYK